MKRMILVVLLVAATVQISSAQHPDNANRKGKAHHEMQKRDGEHQRDPKVFMAKELGLSDEQAEAFAPIYISYREELKGEKPQRHEMKKDADDSEIIAGLQKGLDRNIRVATVRKAYVEKFGTVLTPKQIVKLYMMEDAHANGHHDKSGKPGGKPELGRPGHDGHAGAHPRSFQPREKSGNE